jgi:radical SAM/Cys-rich protein
MTMHMLTPSHDITFPQIHRHEISTLQVNIGYRCNQACAHCHVDAGPHRTEMMDAATLELIPRVLAARGISILDITGGAPELHPGFRALVEAARRLGVRIIDRCNLSVLLEPGNEDLPEFLAAHTVEIVASLPCYCAENVDQQRGEGAFAKSIAALQRLNALGYGAPASGLVLNLVYNPGGPSLPPNQVDLEADYQRELKERYGIVFNHLFALANMPIGRFASRLAAQGALGDYLCLLKANFRPENLEALMCRTLVSVDWQGFLYDCDFNQQLGIPLGGSPSRVHLRALLDDDWKGRAVGVAEHCFGCTAGQGSSCGGALLEAAP